MKIAIGAALLVALALASGAQVALAQMTQDCINEIETSCRGIDLPNPTIKLENVCSTVQTNYLNTVSTWSDNCVRYLNRGEYQIEDLPEYESVTNFIEACQAKGMLSFDT